MESDFPILYINLEKSHDRNEYMIHQFKKHNLKNYQRINAVELKNLNTSHSIQILNKLEILLRKEHALIYSHITALKFFLEQIQSEHCLILEDDASFEFYQQWNNSLTNIIREWPKRYNIIRVGTYISGNYIANQTYRKGKYFRWRNNWGAYAYIINKQGAEEILKSVYQNSILTLNPDKYYLVADSLLFRLTSTCNYHVPLFTTNIALDSQLRGSNKSHINYHNRLKSLYQIF